MTAPHTAPRDTAAPRYAAPYAAPAVQRADLAARADAAAMLDEVMALALAGDAKGAIDLIGPGLRRALGLPGPVLTRVVISYHGRDIRWLKALKASYIDRLSNGQKARMATRVVARSLNPKPRND